MSGGGFDLGDWVHPTHDDHTLVGYTGLVVGNDPGGVRVRFVIEKVYPEETLVLDRATWRRRSAGRDDSRPE